MLRPIQAFIEGRLNWLRCYHLQNLSSYSTDNSPNLWAYFLMASSNLLNQSRWFQFLPRNLSNVRLFSDLPSQHPVSVSEPQNNIDSKSNNRFNKASSTPSSLKEPELAKFSAIADTWLVKMGCFRLIQQGFWNALIFFGHLYYVQVGFWRTI